MTIYNAASRWRSSTWRWHRWSTSPARRCRRSPKTGSIPNGVVPPDVVRFLARLRLLEGVPFNYLVPDATMLPLESIRFFYVDRNWLDALGRRRTERRHCQLRRPRTARLITCRRARRGRHGRAHGADERCRRARGRRRRQADRRRRADDRLRAALQVGVGLAGHARSRPTPPILDQTTRRFPTWTPAPIVCASCGWSAWRRPCCWCCSTACRRWCISKSHAQASSSVYG